MEWKQITGYTASSPASGPQAGTQLFFIFDNSFKHGQKQGSPSGFPAPCQAVFQESRQEKKTRGMGKWVCHTMINGRAMTGNMDRGTQKPAQRMPWQDLHKRETGQAAVKWVQNPGKQSPPVFS